MTTLREGGRYRIVKLSKDDFYVVTHSARAFEGAEGTAVRVSLPKERFWFVPTTKIKEIKDATGWRRRPGGICLVLSGAVLEDLDIPDTPELKAYDEEDQAE